jgi:type I restriction enzyme S subunit
MKMTLGDVAEFIRGVTYKPEDVMESASEGSIVCMRTANVQVELDESSLTSIRKDLVRDPQKHLREGDLLVSVANSWNLVGKCCWVPTLPYQATAGGFIAILRAERSRVEPRYLYHWFSSARTQAAARACSRQTTNISNMDISRCLSIELAVPDLEEQRHVVRLMDKVDEQRKLHRSAIGQLDSLLELLHERKFFPSHH